MPTVKEIKSKIVEISESAKFPTMHEFFYGLNIDLCKLRTVMQKMVNDGQLVVKDIGYNWIYLTPDRNANDGDFWDRYDITTQSKSK